MTVFFQRFFDRSRAPGFEGIDSLVARISEVSGFPGMSVGVLHEGTVVYEGHFGYRDIENRTMPDSDTVYPIASLTKAFTSAAVGILVQEGTLQWTTPINTIIPELNDNASYTIVDFLSHRTGVARADALYLQSNNTILLPKSDDVPTFSYLPIVEPLRTEFIYNNFAYSIIGDIIERLTGQTYGDFLRQRIFEPLGMIRTFTKNLQDNSNIACAYSVLQDRSPYPIPLLQISENTMMAASGSIRSSIADLLRFYAAFLHAAKDQFSNARTTTPGSPLAQISQILQPHVSMSITSLREQTYGLGWARAELPGTLGLLGANNGLVASMPEVLSKGPSRLCVYHEGSMPGGTSAVYLFPETQSGVVVLQNSIALSDSAGWVGELFTEALFGGANLEKYILLAEESSKQGRLSMDKVAQQLENEKVPGTQHRPFEQYVGRYWNAIHNYFIEVIIDSDGNGQRLQFKFQGLESERFDLRHYDYDVFVWNTAFDEATKRARYIDRPAWYYKFFFESEGYESDPATPPAINILRWRYDATVEGGESFKRQVDNGF